MKIAPIDITHKSFKRRMSGYDADEVSSFLTAVADEFEDVIRERNQLRESLREKEMQILEYRDRDKVLKDTITTAQRMSEKMRLEGEREAKLIVNDAQQKAEMIVRDSRDSLKALYREISDLKRIKAQFEANMRAMVQAHIALIENRDHYMPNVEFAESDKQIEK